MISKTSPRANTRALFSAALAGSALGLGLTAAYLAGANSTSGLMHIRARSLAAAQAQGFSDVALQRANGLSPGALAIAERHDPFTVSGGAQRDRESADFAARLDQAGPSPMAVSAVSLMLRPQLGPEGDNVSGRLRFAAIGALDGARDLDCLTQAVYYEARGESDRGQAAVAQVVLNRLRHPAFPKTICAVVFQGAGAHRADCQFSFVCDGSMRESRDDEAWGKAQHIAARALSGVVMADIGAATHFHAVSIGQQWGDGLVRVATVGLHVFYKFGHAHAPFQAQVFQANLDRGADVRSSEVKPVLASLLPPPATAEAGKADPAKEISSAAEAPKPVAAAQAPKPVAAAKVESPTA